MLNISIDLFYFEDQSDWRRIVIRNQKLGFKADDSLDAVRFDVYDDANWLKELHLLRLQTQLAFRPYTKFSPHLLVGFGVCLTRHHRFETKNANLFDGNQTDLFNPCDFEVNGNWIVFDVVVDLLNSTLFLLPEFDILHLRFKRFVAYKLGADLGLPVE